MLLAGDVGGTKTTLALYETSLSSVEKVREASFRSADFTSLEQLCLRFLDSVTDVAPPRTACFGVPGAVDGGRCQTTNLPWSLHDETLARAIGVRRVVLLNDLQAYALGALHQPEKDLGVLQSGRDNKREGRNVAIVAPGTGLGEGLLAWDGRRHLPIASEGGHATFAPENAREEALAAFLRERHGGHVSWERVLSGPGLVSLYAFVKSEGQHEESPSVAARFANEDHASVIGTCAVNQSDRLCVEAVELFGALLGAEAGNVALKFLALGGVYLGGGVVTKLMPALVRSSLVTRFSQKGRFCDLLRGVPVWVVHNERAPLLGAALYARSVTR